MKDTIHSLIHSIRWVNDNSKVEINLDGAHGTSNIFYGSVNDLYKQYGYKVLSTTDYYSVLCARDLNTISIGIKLF